MFQTGVLQHFRPHSLSLKCVQLLNASLVAPKRFRVNAVHVSVIHLLALPSCSGIIRTGYTHSSTS